MRSPSLALVHIEVLNNYMQPKNFDCLKCRGECIAYFNDKCCGFDREDGFLSCRVAQRLRRGLFRVKPISTPRAKFLHGHGRAGWLTTESNGDLPMLSKVETETHSVFERLSKTQRAPSHDSCNRLASAAFLGTTKTGFTFSKERKVWLNR